MKHKHIYDEQGKQLCCTQEEKIYTQAGAKQIVDDTCCSTDGEANQKGNTQREEVGRSSIIKMFLPSIISLVLLLVALYFDNVLKPEWFTDWVRIVWYVVAYAPVGFPVLKEAVESIRKGEVFSEFFLMGIATIGAFTIGEYPEGVAVMLFY
ncbi:MAG: heavy metal translocating P-type ATPase, partial [Sphingobacterium sp.]